MAGRRNREWVGVLATLGTDLPADLFQAALIELNQVANRHGFATCATVTTDGRVELRLSPAGAGSGSDGGWQVAVEGGTPAAEDTAPREPPGAAVGGWEVQLRWPLGAGPEDHEEVMDALIERLTGPGEFVDDVEEEGPEFCAYLYGPDRDDLLRTGREAAAELGLGAGAYLVARDVGSDDPSGERHAL